MKIVCPKCETWYEVPDASSGRKVRCAECRTLWTASPADAAALEAAARAAARRESEAAAAAAAAAVPAPAFATAEAGGTGDDRGGTDADGWPEDLSPPPREKPFDLDEAATANRDSVEDAPSVVPEHDAFAEPGPPPRDWDAEFEAAEARRLAREEAKPTVKRPWQFAMPRPSWTTVVLGLLVVIGVVLGWRVNVVRAMPQTGPLFAKLGLPVNLRGLALENVKVEMDTADNVAVVVVEGVIVNVAKVRIEVPRLRYSMRDGSGAEIYTWTALPEKAALAPGEVQPFRTRLASPPAESRDIQVRFFTRRDR